MTMVEIILLALTTLLAFALGVAAGYWYFRKRNPFLPTPPTYMQGTHTPLPEPVALPDFTFAASSRPTFEATSGDSIPNHQVSLTSTLPDRTLEIIPPPLPGAPVELEPLGPTAMVLPLLEYLENSIQLPPDAEGAKAEPRRGADADRPAVAHANVPAPSQPAPPRPVFQRLNMLDLTPDRTSLAATAPPRPSPPHYTPLSKLGDTTTTTAMPAAGSVAGENALLQIRGIDAGLVERLARLGITTVAQIAHCTSYEVRKLAERIEVSPEVIMQEWIPQAHLLLYTPAAS